MEAGNDPVMLYTILANKLGQAGYTKEALMAAQEGKKLGAELGLTQAKTLQEQAQARKYDAEAMKAGIEKQEEIVRLHQAKQQALINNDVELANSIDAQIAKNTYISEKTMTPENESDKTILEDYIKSLGEVQGARAFQQYKLSQRISANEALNPAKTTAQKTVDTTFAKEYTDYQALGGSALIDEQLKKLSAVTNYLANEENITGKLVGAANMAGDTALATLSPKALEARDIVGSVVQSNLREVLGGQFAQKEGEALLARAYNISASPKDNLNRLLGLQDRILEQKRLREAAMNYYEENGSLVGFKPSAYKPTVNDIISSPSFKYKSSTERAKLVENAIKNDPKFSALPEIEKLKVLNRAVRADTVKVSGKQVVRPKGWTDDLWEQYVQSQGDK
jgi:hypothetical protein